MRVTEDLRLVGVLGKRRRGIITGQYADADPNTLVAVTRAL
jgi:hypothetical protein